MSERELRERIETLEKENAPYAIAMVVVRRSPVSAHLGDRAIVLANGTMHGFVGGSCSRDIVRRQGIDAIRTGRPRLLQIRPDRSEAPEDRSSETVVVPMGCASEGAVDVYIEPHLPPRAVVIVGHTPVAESLARLSAANDGYRIVRVVSQEELGDLSSGDAPAVVTIDALASYLGRLPENERERMVAIVASQGHYDERALGLLLAGGELAFVGLLASRKRAATVLGSLEQEGVPADRLAVVHNPVGLDIGARTPGEVAVSILAEIIATTTATMPQPAPVEEEACEHCHHS